MTTRRKPTPKMIQACAKVMREHDWLPEGWDEMPGSHYCSECGRLHNINVEGDGGEQVRREIAEFLEVTLRAAP